VRVLPNAGRTAIEEIVAVADGRAALKLRVAAIPDKNKANDAVIALLAQTLGVARSAIRITSGATARLKTLHIAGDGPVLAARLAAALPASRDKTSH
jgi:uncharacterized protein YggU (UPF0235/DUF167 family)